MTMISKISEKFRDWNHQRYLKKRGWTQLAYDRHMDTDIVRHAETLNQYYSGYPYKFEFTSARVRPFTDYPTWTEAYDAMNTWCNEKCTGKWRQDIHRVFKQTGLDLDGNEYPEWHLNDISGVDVLFFVFQNEQDALMFSLRWV